MVLNTTPDWFHLGDDEDLVWESRPHPIELGPGFPIAVGLAVLGVGVLAWGLSDGWIVVLMIGAVVVLSCAGIASVRYLFWTNTRYVTSPTTKVVGFPH